MQALARHREACRRLPRARDAAGRDGEREGRAGDDVEPLSLERSEGGIGGLKQHARRRGKHLGVRAAARSRGCVGARRRLLAQRGDGPRGGTNCSVLAQRRPEPACRSRPAERALSQRSCRHLAPHASDKVLARRELHAEAVDIAAVVVLRREQEGRRRGEQRARAIAGVGEPVDATRGLGEPIHVAQSATELVAARHDPASARARDRQPALLCFELQVAQERVREGVEPELLGDTLGQRHVDAQLASTGGRPHVIFPHARRRWRRARRGGGARARRAAGGERHREQRRPPPARGPLDERAAGAGETGSDGGHDTGA
jgi:hypothetical protein